jgi:SagB-type dehydrogenase family enzyme
VSLVPPSYFELSIGGGAHQAMAYKICSAKPLKPMVLSVSPVSLGRRSFLGLVAGAFTAAAGLALFSLGKFDQPNRTLTGNSQTVQVDIGPRTSGSVSVEEALAARRSIRDYADESLTIDQVMQLLWAAQGITNTEYSFRTAPSAGGTYPLEIYLVARASGVVGLEAGIYRYEPRNHALIRMVKGEFSGQLMAAALDQEWVGAAPVNFVITAVFERTTGKYGERGTRYVWQETGHAAQNIYLQAVALGLGNVVVGGFHDTEIQKVLQLSDHEMPAYVIPIGVLKTSQQ